MTKPTFLDLWNNYPSNRLPCDGSWTNQCAIRMSICLNDEGTITVSSATYSEPKCSHGHARGAESLANWLWKHHLGRPSIYTDPASGKNAIKGKNGVIFFKDCFTRPGETRSRGDHIDLWKSSVTKTFGDPQNNSAQLWFWELV